MYQALLAASMVPMPMYFPSTSYDGLRFMASPATAPACHGCCHGPLPRMTADEQQDPPSLPDHLRCGYTSKRCENPRTVKKSGGMHRFCAYHRERANKNQWRVDNRRRIQKKRRSHMSPTKTAEPSSDCDSPRSTTSTTSSLESHHPDDNDCALQLFRRDKRMMEMEDNAFESLEATGSPDSLSDQDAEILNAMLFNDDDADGHHQQTTATVTTSATRANFNDRQHGQHDNSGFSIQTHAPVSSSCGCASCAPSATMIHYDNAARAASRWQTYARL